LGLASNEGLGVGVCSVRTHVFERRPSRHRFSASPRHAAATACNSVWLLRMIRDDVSYALVCVNTMKPPSDLRSACHFTSPKIVYRIQASVSKVPAILSTRRSPRAYFTVVSVRLMQGELVHTLSTFSLPASSDQPAIKGICIRLFGQAGCNAGVPRWSYATPNVRVEAGPTVLRLARAVHHVPQALRGQGAMPLGLASNEGLGHAGEAACGHRARRLWDWCRRW